MGLSIVDTNMYKSTTEIGNLIDKDTHFIDPQVSWNREAYI